MSALIIIAHVKEGVDLALKHDLNRQIIDVIQDTASAVQEQAEASDEIARNMDIPEGTIRRKTKRY